MGKVCVFFGTGYEEIEALTVVDLLRREDIPVDMVSVTGEETVVSSHGIGVKMDCLLEDVDFGDVDMIVLPGGMPGTVNLEACGPLMEQVDAFYQAGKNIAAICAAPSILGHRGMLKGKKACSYPSFEDHLEGAEVTQNPVEVTDHIITGRGMGCAIDFGLAIVGKLRGKEQAAVLAGNVIYKHYER